MTKPEFRQAYTKARREFLRKKAKEDTEVGYYISTQYHANSRSAAQNRRQSQRAD